MTATELATCGGCVAVVMLVCCVETALYYRRRDAQRAADPADRVPPYTLL